MIKLQRIMQVLLRCDVCPRTHIGLNLCDICINCNRGEELVHFLLLDFNFVIFTFEAPISFYVVL